MKQRLSLVIFILCGCWQNAASGQEFRFPVDGKNLKRIEIVIGNSNIEVIGHARSEVVVSGTELVSNSHEMTSDRSWGLKRLSHWEDNSGIGFHVSQHDGVLQVIRTYYKARGSFKIYVPASANLDIREEHWGRGSVHVKGGSAATRVKTNSSNITLEDIGGDVRVETVSGSITAEFSSWENHHHRKISTVSGVVEVRVKPGSSFDIDLSTVSGRIDSEFPIKEVKEYKGSTLTRISALRNASCKINGGGSLLDLNSVSGVIKLAKAAQ